MLGDARISELASLLPVCRSLHTVVLERTSGTLVSHASHPQALMACFVAQATPLARPAQKRLRLLCRCARSSRRSALPVRPRAAVPCTVLRLVSGTCRAVGSPRGVAPGCLPSRGAHVLTRPRTCAQQRDAPQATRWAPRVLGRCRQAYASATRWCTWISLVREWVSHECTATFGGCSPHVLCGLLVYHGGRQ